MMKTGNMPMLVIAAAPSPGAFALAGISGLALSMRWR